MRELVRDEIAAGDRLIRRRQKILRSAIVAGLMMLDALEADFVAQGEQRMIVRKVTRPVQRKCFLRDVLVRSEKVARDREILGMIGEDIELDEGARSLPKRPFLRVTPHVERRID